VSAGGVLSAVRVLGLHRVFCLTALIASTAQGQTVMPQPVFVVRIAADAPERMAFREILSDVADRHDLELQISVVARIDANAIIRGPDLPLLKAPLGRAFVDLTDAKVATLYVVDGPWKRILMREVLRTSNPDVDREVLGRMVATAVEALQGGSFVQSSEPMAGFVPPPPKVTAQAPPPGQEQSDQAAQPPLPRQGKLVRPAEEVVRSLGPKAGDLFATAAPGIGAGYEMQLMAPGGTIAHGPTLYGELAFGKGATRPLVWLTGQYRLPVYRSPESATASPIGYRLDAIALRALAGAQRTLSHRLTVEAGVGLGLDIIDLQPRAIGPSAYSDPKRSYVVGLGRAMVGLRWRLTPFVSAQTVLLADIGGRTPYQFKEDDGTIREVLPTYLIRPGLAISLSLR
jgi:hypothetical protein